MKLFTKLALELHDERIRRAAYESAYWEGRNRALEDHIITQSRTAHNKGFAEGYKNGQANGASEAVIEEVMLAFGFEKVDHEDEAPLDWKDTESPVILGGPTFVVRHEPEKLFTQDDIDSITNAHPVYPAPPPSHAVDEMLS